MIGESLQRALGASRRLVGWIVLAGVVLYGLSGIYSVKPDEVAVHQRFGRIVDARVPSGIHYALPWPIDRVNKVPILKVHRLVIDDFQAGDDPGSAAGLFRMISQLHSFCVTGDNNVVNVGCAVQYMISDPAAFLFHTMAPEAILRAVACNSLIHCLAGMKVDHALTMGNQQIKAYVHSEMNRRLDALGVGLVVAVVDLIPLRPPQEVRSYFDDVVNSKIDKRKMVNQAEADRNERLSRARVEATRVENQALGAKATTIEQARGKASRFVQRLSEYRKAPDVTRRRLWLEFVRDVLGKVRRKYVVEADDRGPAAGVRIVTP